MTRQRKILFGAAFIGLVITSIVFLAKPKQSPVRITYGGVSKGGSNRVFFVITNPFPKQMHFIGQVESMTDRSFRPPGSSAAPFRASVEAYGQTNIYVDVPP